MRIIAICLLLITGLVSAQELQSHEQSITVTINHEDGGDTNPQHLDSLLDALNESGCQAVFPTENSEASAQLLFDPNPVSIVEGQRPNYRLIARARALDGNLTVRGAVLVHAAKGITNLEALQGEWISFVGKDSLPGYRLPAKLLQRAGVNAENSHFYFVGNHVGAVSALLHRDVHVAITAEPLARRWAGQNGLAIVAVTEPVETGGWWIQKGLPDSFAQRCGQALTRMNRAQHKALPAWIDGFVDP